MNKSELDEAIGLGVLIGLIIAVGVYAFMGAVV